MLHHAIALQDLIQDRERTPAVHHIVLRDDLEPVHHRLPFQDVLVVRYPQTYTDSIVGVSIKSIGRHVVGFLVIRKSGEREEPGPPAYCCKFTPVSWSRRWHSRPYLCKSSCLCSRYPRFCNRLCPCRNSYLHSCASPSPFCFSSFFRSAVRLIDPGGQNPLRFPPGLPRLIAPSCPRAGP